MIYRTLILLMLVGCRSRDAASHEPDKVVEHNDTLAASCKTPQGTVKLLYQAVRKKDYKTAYSLWQRSDGSNASGKSYGDFTRGYEQTKSAEIVFTDSVVIEGAAGSLYANVPARIQAVTNGGDTQTFVGTYVLRKTNIEPGSDTLPWHIESGRFTLLAHP